MRHDTDKTFTSQKYGSLGPKLGVTVSMLGIWEKVRPLMNIGDFTINNAIPRLKEMGDMFAGVLGGGIDLMQTVQKAQALLPKLLKFIH